MAFFASTSSVVESKGPKQLHLKDYRPPSHLIDKTELCFELNAPNEVMVHGRLFLRPNPLSDAPSHTMVLNGAPETAPEGSETPTMKLLKLEVNGVAVAASDYHRVGDTLTLRNLPAEPFVLDTTTVIDPEANRSLNGLYTSGGKFTTQCESEGFRNITFYLDRPDVMAEFSTTLIAPKGKYPQLLSNGNPGPRITTPDGRDAVTWHDPFKKPSYLFALVAGDLGMIEDTFTTCSGRKVQIQIYCDHGDEAKLHHAMVSVHQAMKWDEERFGREYDLDLFQIVAVNDFNFGAMENKGLNIFNSSAVLADPQTATDTRYEYIQAVVAHEYFHNWSGDRVTLQKWFDLTLKEGFTVFRDSEFTADLNSRAVKRIDDVTGMRTVQFAEDAGAMAHPIRPSSVGSIENFYTTTVYEKGCEVIRMIHTMLGEAQFRKGSDLYFHRHDGQAVSTEDFVRAMADASGMDLSQFEDTWYNQAGTPTVECTDAYDPAQKTYTLTISQSTPPTPGQPTKKPFHIPIRVGLLNAQGEDMALKLKTSQQHLLSQGDVLHLKEAVTSFVFEGVPERPIPSLLRNWSAPVKVKYPYTRQQLMFLMAHDSDSFNRWDAGQQLGVDVLQECIAAARQGKPYTVDPLLIEAVDGVLKNQSLDPALAARTLALPSGSYLMELYDDGDVDVDAIFGVRKHVRATLGKALEGAFLRRFEGCRSSEGRPYTWNGKDAGERAMKNSCLAYLVVGNPEKYLSLALAQYDQHHNMTDMRSAMGLILEYGDVAAREARLAEFYATHKDNPLAMTQWFTDQALVDREDVLETVRGLLSHPAYEPKNPNSVRGLVGAFASNPVQFHRKDGAGYAFLAEQIVEIDKFNPMLAAGLAKKLSTPHKFDGVRQGLMKTQLANIQEGASSKNVQEIVTKSLDLLVQKQGPPSP